MPKKSKKGFNKHPYGLIPINSSGFYDNDWDEPKTKPRFAFFGDSVTYGVGAGYPFRITEYLDNMNKEIEHINISGGVGISFSALGSVDNIRKITVDNKIDKLIYLMNLNDISDLAYSKNEKKDIKYIKKNNLVIIKSRLFFIDKFLRGNSKLYTYIRFKLKNIILLKFKLNETGYKAIELTPDKYINDINFAAKQLGEKISKLEKMNIKVCTLILPYEMQISKSAANYYKKIGINFDENFLEFKTQKIFISEFKNNSSAEIFYLKNNFPEDDIGTYYVFNLGDKIDFNHPNRKGHKLIARQIVSQKLCIK